MYLLKTMYFMCVPHYSCVYHIMFHLVGFYFMSFCGFVVRNGVTLLLVTRLVNFSIISVTFKVLQMVRMLLNVCLFKNCLKNCIPYSLYLGHSASFSKLLSKCSVKLHPNECTLKMKVTFPEQLLWLYLLSDVMSDVIIGNDELKL